MIFVAKSKKIEPIEGQMDLVGMLFPEEVQEEVEVCEKMTEPECPAVMDSEEYWMWCVFMLAAWGAYVAKQDLWDNANDPDKKHRVWHVVVSHFDGKLWKLEDRKNDVFNEFLSVYSQYQTVCQNYGVEPVDRKWLRTHLWEGGDIGSYRNRCKTRQKSPEKYPAVSLKDFSPRKPKKGGK